MVEMGHSSHNGLGSTIDLVTGLPNDFHTLSFFKCKIMENVNKVTPEWREKHSQTCAKNFDGSFNAMEAVCATVLWKCSVKNFGLGYTTMLCDGDSKTFDAISDAEKYVEKIRPQ